MKIGETVMSACRREVREETGIDVVEITLVGVYSDIDRDPRGHIVSVAFMTELADETRPRVGSDAMSAEWVDMHNVDLAFDNANIPTCHFPRQPQVLKADTKRIWASVPYVPRAGKLSESH